MADRTQRKKREIPFGCALITLGGLMLGIMILILLLSPVQLPLSEQLRLAFGAVVPSVAQLFESQPVAADVGTGVLLPETRRVLDSQLPSEARVTDLLGASLPPGPGQPVRIVIPTLQVDAPVQDIGLQTYSFGGQESYQWAVPNLYAAGWHNTSAPLGNVGNTVLNGHHNIYGEVFRYLPDIGLGDKIIMYDGDGKEFVYHVDGKELLLERGQSLEVRRQNASWIEPTQDERLTLVTCWPYTDNSHRYVIVAHRDS